MSTLQRLLRGGVVLALAICIMSLCVQESKCQGISGKDIVDNLEKVGTVFEAESAARGGNFLSKDGTTVDLAVEQFITWDLENLKSGKYYACFKVRTGAQGGYEYIKPKMTYKCVANGKSINLIPAKKDPALLYDAGTFKVFTGWIHSKEAIALEPGSKIALSCMDSYAFVDKLVLLPEDTHSDVIYTPADEIRDRIIALYPSKGIPKLDMTGLSENTRDKVMTLINGWESFEKDSIVKSTKEIPGRMDEKAEKKMEETISEIFLHVKALGLIPILQDTQKMIDEIEKINPSPAYFAGRESIYYKNIAQSYYDEAKKLIRTEKPMEDTTVKAMTYTKYSFENTRKSLAYAKQPKPEIIPALQLSVLANPSTIPSDDKKEISEFRTEVCLNGEWGFSADGSPDAPPAVWGKIRVPHGPWSESIGGFFNLDQKWMANDHDAWYRLKFIIPGEWKDKKIKISFNGVFHYTEVFVNGGYCGNHTGGFENFEIDITDRVNPGRENLMLVYVQDTKKTNLGPMGPSGGSSTSGGITSGPNYYMISDLWGANYGGIWQDVFLKAYPKIHIDDVFVITSVKSKEITAKVWIENEDNKIQQVTVSNTVRKDGKTELELGTSEVITVNPQETKMVEFKKEWSTPEIWGIGGEYGKPTLYFLCTKLRIGGEDIDTEFTRFGFREFRIAETQFLLNEKEIFIQGDHTWYLQEGHIAQGNKWFVTHLYNIERKANVNMVRFHRHGDVTPDYYDAADELGMLCEPETSFWGATPPVDICDNGNFDDPVWVKNIENYYIDIARKHRNHPSIAIWSAENESFIKPTEPALNRALQFDKATKQEDPNRPIDHHGSIEPEFEIANFHYPSNDQFKNWQTLYGSRPVMDGEFNSFSTAHNMCVKNQETAKAAGRDTAEYFSQKIKFYRDINLSGIMPFLLSQHTLFSTASPELMGPWHDILKPVSEYKETGSEWSPIEYNTWVSPMLWPSLSGKGIKAERMPISNYTALINWFDPTRPESTPNEVYYAIQEAFRPMPPLNDKKVPEVIVKVEQGNQPLAGINVFLIPRENQSTNPIGVMTDKNGTAWFILKEPGKYEIYAQGYGKKTEKIIINAPLTVLSSLPGYDYIQKVELKVK